MDSFHPRVPAGINPSTFAIDQAPSPLFYISYLSSDNGKTIDFTGFDDYSDLNYSIFDITLNINLNLTEKWSIFAVFNYTDFNDSEPYVYGDLDGEFYTANIGLQYKF